MSLTITNASGCSSTITKAIKIKQQPDVNFKDDNVPYNLLNLTNQFSNCGSASASNPNYSVSIGNLSSSVSCISSYSINWGDGNSTSNVSFPANHSYTQLGAFQMVVTAIGSNGCLSSKTYTVKNESNPSGSLSSPGSTENLCAPTPNLEFVIANWGKNSPTTIYTIDYGDTTPSLILTQTQLNASVYYNSSNPALSANYPVPHMYDSTSCPNASITATLVMTNSCGTTKSTISPISILRPSVSKFTIPINGCVNSNIVFINNSTPSLNQSCVQSTLYEWNFGDGSPISSITSTGIPNINHSYSSPGTYVVSLTTYGYCGNPSVFKSTICIEPPLAPQFTLNATEGCSPLTVATTNTTDLSKTCSVFTYAWDVQYTSGFCGTAPAVWSYATGSATSASPSFNLVTPGTYSIKVTISGSSCGSVTSSVQKVTITQPPTLTINTISNFCQNVTLNPIANINICSPDAAGTTYLWTFIGGIPATTTTAVPPAVSYALPGNYRVSLAVTNECGTTTVESNAFAVQVAPIVQNEIIAVCSGTSFSVTPSNATLGNAIPVGTTYSWNTPIVTGGISGGVLGTGQTSISGTLINNTTTAQTARYTITPKIGLCSGNSFTLIVLVNPTPIISGTLKVCVGLSTTLTGSATPATTNPWISSNTAIATVSTTGVVNGIAAGSATITYTNSNGCQKTATITVNALPTVTVNSPVVCSGLSATVIATSGISGTYSYVWNVPSGFTNPGNVASFPTTIAGTYSVIITNTTTGCVSSSASGTVTANALPNLLITNPSAVCSPTTVDITSSNITTGSDPGLTLTYWTNSLATIALSNPNAVAVSGTYYIKAVNTNGCTLIKPVVVTVNTTPTVTTILNLVKCNGDISSTIAFTGSVVGTTFEWTNDTPSIGLSSAGIGNIASFTVMNSGLIPLIATVTVTPKANGCIGTPKNFTITVNPTPTVEQPLNQEVCNGLSTVDIPFTGNIPSTIYSWTNSNSSIGLPASGSGTIPSFTGSNATSAPKNATITVTPSINGCPGASKSFSITVNPSPVITFTPAPQTICSGENAAAVSLNSSTAGVTFSWTTTQPAGITETIQTSGTSSIPTQTLTNTTNAAITIEYNATATVAGVTACLGASYKYTIIVKPKPSITSSLAQTICSTTAFSLTPTDGSGNIVPSGTVYTWSAAVISPSGAISGANAQNTPQSSISQTLVNGTNQSAIATYTVTPRSGTCSGTAFPVVITVNPSPKVVFSGVNQKICSGNDAAVINLSSPTTGSITFNWTASIPPGITGATTSGTTAVIPIQTLTNTTTDPLTVIYTATATLNDGVVCQGQPNTYSITVNPAIITSSVLSNHNGFNLSTVGANDGSIAVWVSGGSGSYTYSWSGPNSFLASSQDIANLIAGDYTLTINDGLCDPVILSFTLTEPQSLVIQEDTAAHANIFCNGYSTGIIKVVITQQSIGPYKYELILQGGGIVQSSLNNSALDYTFAGLVAGTYDIKVTDSNGSLKTIVGVIISQPLGITASMSAQTNVLCFGDSTGSATVTAIGGSGALTYSWNTIPIQTTPTATGLTAGTYTVTITDTNSCATEKQVVITEPDRLVTSISTQTNILCFGNSTGTATIAVSGGEAPYAFSWSTLINNTGATASGLSADTYNVTVTDANNCTKVQQVIITQPTAVLESSISSFNNVSCFGGSDGMATVAVTNGSAPYTYSWNTVPVQTGATATGLTKGNYSVKVIDINGCETTSVVAIEQPAAISTSISAQINVACSGSDSGSATIVPNGGTAPYTFSWNTTPMQTAATGINLAKGTYLVTVVDANNCSTIQQVVITEPNGLVTAIASQVNVDCFGKSTGSVAVSVSGGTAPLTYSWDTPTANTTLSASGLVAGSYHLTVSDANGCQKIQEVKITEPADLAITTNLEKDVTCFGDSDGAIKITVSGGTSVYSYSWTKDGTAFANTEDLSNLSSGIYQITVSDANNCGPKTATFTITEPPVLEVTFGSKTDIKCFGTETGAINVNVIGGTASTSGYNFAWTGPNGFASASQNLIGVFAGTYNLIVTDNSGCTDRLTVILTQPSLVIVSATTTPIVCYGDNDASIRLNVSGGVAPYTVLWSNLAVGLVQDNLSAGDYVATITDANNCIKTITVNIPEAPLFKMDPTVTQISCFGARDGSVKLNLVGGIPIVKLVWSDNSLAGTTRNNLGPGTYTATIIDGTPCQITKTFVIIEPQVLVLAANTTNALNCDDANSGAINLLVSGGTPPFSYVWSNGAVTEDLNAIPAGNYLVTVTDARKCSASGSYSVIRPAAIAVKVETATDFNCETKVVKQSFVAKTSGGVPPYQFEWSSGSVSGPNNEIMSTSQNGLVVLNAIDSRNCSTTYTFDVAIPQLGTPSFTTASIGYSTYGIYSIEDPIQFTNTASGDYTAITWDFGDATFSTEENPTHIYKKEGTYIVIQTVTYPFGCVYVRQITLEVEKGYRLIPPTGFTPNNDGVNDYFAPVLLGLNEIHFDVYDTWGSLIYSESGENIRGWDGKINNKEGENGNYYFTITAKTFYGKIIKDKGALVLIN